ncbi:DUF3387 domain-containing protein [Escherichia coli]|nr:DUF3387 domain-containing protein [Escherichia coli]
MAKELLEKLIRSPFQYKNVVQEKKYSECLQAVLIKYNNRAMETAQMTEVSESFQPVMVRDDVPALNIDKITFYEALQKTKASFGRREKSNGRSHPEVEVINYC